MRHKGSAEVLADRRRRVLALLDEGHSLNKVARRIGCQASSVMRWRDKREAEGAAVFEVGASPGRPPKLSGRQLEQLIELLQHGAMEQGYSTDLWTCKRITKLIRKQFRASRDGGRRPHGRPKRPSSSRRRRLRAWSSFQ